MFNTNDVDSVLSEGQKFIEKLDTAVTATQEKALAKQVEIDKLIASRSALDLKVRKGQIVSQRVSSLLTVTEDDLNQNGIPDSEEE